MQGFAELLLRIGEGRKPIVVVVHTIRLPADMAAPAPTVEELADWLYGTNPIGLIGGAAAGRLLLTPGVADVHALNDMILARAPGEAVVSLSADCCERDDDSALYATEYLNSLSPSGLPHKLVPKILDRVGLYLSRPVFSHGQLYVAMSRAFTLTM
ncbi:hypothetical protein WJX81_007512 [Elliptochloris bilobata]|uniref:Uncharacterized protein n=1 Tax=Elliptochloris bilobata TaxID=381761 RepID=A0AAW1SJS9_9CHLO